MPGTRLARRADQAAQAQRQRGQRQVLLDVQLQRLADVLAQLGGLAQAARIAGLRGGREAGDPVCRQHRLGRALGYANEVTEGERRKLEPELEHLGARAATRTLRGLVELL